MALFLEMCGNVYGPIHGLMESSVKSIRTSIAERKTLATNWSVEYIRFRITILNGGMLRAKVIERFTLFVS